ncbi:hypothetical protein [Streptomyces inusitatus]|uniref:hypothetical protein n=1 Tax=Streptomyces inusitatus TaxID=68221 RepID=UPI00167EA517|nr:hypothetical protein [Streptomyces inusitatus]
MTARTPRGAFTGRPCRSCKTPIPSRFYLCSTCWLLLPPPTRDALSLRDESAVARLRALYDHIDSGLLLADLEITS